MVRESIGHLPSCARLNNECASSSCQWLPLRASLRVCSSCLVLCKNQHWQLFCIAVEMCRFFGKWKDGELVGYLSFIQSC